MQRHGELAGLDIYIDDSSIVDGAADAGEAAPARAARRQLDLVLIDYLQLMHGGGRSRDNRVQEVSEISRGLKMLARELDVPVIAAAQLSRAPEQRQPHIPMLSDLRESGSIEQDADVVMFIYREDIYVTREDWEMRNFDQPYPEGITKLIVAKHRNGPTGVVHLRFRNHLSRFEDLMVRRRGDGVTGDLAPASHLRRLSRPRRSRPRSRTSSSPTCCRSSRTMPSRSASRCTRFNALQAKRGLPALRHRRRARPPSRLSLVAYARAPNERRRDGDADRRAASRAPSSSACCSRSPSSRTGRASTLYFLNTPADRRGLEAVRTGAVDLGASSATQPRRARRALEHLRAVRVAHRHDLAADRRRAGRGRAALSRRVAGGGIPRGGGAERALAGATSHASWNDGQSKDRTMRRLSESAAGDDRYFRGKYGRILKQRLKP